MNILYLAHRIPYPPDKGDKIRSYHQLQYLAQRHRVWCAFFVDRPDDWKHVQSIADLCVAAQPVPLHRRPAMLRGIASLLSGGSFTSGFYRSAQMKIKLRAWNSAASFDAAVFFSSSMAPYRCDVNAKRTVLDFCDFDSLKWASYADRGRGFNRLLFALESRRLRKDEYRWLDQFDACTVVTEAELAAMNDHSLTRRVTIIGNGAQITGDAAKSALAGSARIGFVGDMSYPPNVDAVRWFADDVLPRIQQRVENAEFEIVGRSPTREVAALARRPGIRVTGTVDDVGPHLRSFDVSVAPMRMGQGVQNKVLEAMAAGKPVVLTSRAATGVRGVDGRHFVVADDAETTSRRIVELFRDPARRHHIGLSARLHIVEQYSWERELVKLEALLSA